MDFVSIKLQKKYAGVVIKSLVTLFVDVLILLFFVVVEVSTLVEF